MSEPGDIPPRAVFEARQRDAYHVCYVVFCVDFIDQFYVFYRNAGYF
ncbi:MAG: hypothetical protein BWY96_01076 [Spirochaetes bacterium ADurb.BinA120]|nr:MAG: hypothetical protein BWY96_01076 [Spirochaetes bacterium ADurb.BinA120]